ncbi:AAA domain protein, partial [Vibrio parahaemolyticus VPTS-2010]
SLRVRR